MTIECVWEHNGGDTLLHAGNVIGVFTRGSSKEEALGKMPREMYLHTKNVNAYYFTEICVDADNEGAIEDCRARGFSLLETQPDFLAKPAAVGSYGEEWSLRKLFRRFIWHDRIHAKAMHRMGKAIFGEDAIPDVFYFG